MSGSLLVCSNSAPAVDEQGLRAASPGGLVPHLLALLQESGGEWFFPVDEQDRSGWPERVGAVGLHPVTVRSAAWDQHYRTVSVETLLWLMHYLHDTVTSPTFDDRFYRAWTGYQAVNEKIAAAVGHIAGAGDVVLVNDYHLMLVPQGLAGTGARLVYAHQVPWCEPGYFGLLPHALRVQILSSLLTADVIVFHATAWLIAFVRCCQANLPGVSVGPDYVDFAGRLTTVRAVPFPLDVDTVRQLLADPMTDRFRERIATLARGRPTLVRVDRLDLWKNHLRGVSAVEQARHVVADLWFVQVVARTRHRTPRHQEYERDLRAATDRLGDSATLLYQDDPAQSRHQALGALSLATGVLVNSTYDGFNLVAKEAILARPDPTVLLSRTAGSYEYLRSAVIGLDPLDVRDTGERIAAVLTGTGRPDPTELAAARDAVAGDTPSGWLRAVLAERG